MEKIKNTIQNLLIIFIIGSISNLNSQTLGNFIPICTGISYTISQIAVSDGNGGSIIAWKDSRSFAGGFYGIFAQKIDSQGNRLWANNGILIADRIANNDDPKIVADGLGGAIIAWSDKRNDTTGFDIYAQQINSIGTILFPVNGQVVCNEIFDQTDPEIISNGVAGSIIAWTDSRTNYQKDIYAQKINTNGINEWANNGIAICTADFDQYYIKMVKDSQGGVIISWSDFRFTMPPFGGSARIYGQRINNAGVAQWTNNGKMLLLNLGATFAKMVSDDAGGAILVWPDLRFGFSNRTIYCQRINSDGNALWELTDLAIDDIQNFEFKEPEVIADGFGGAIVTWYETRGNTRHDIYAQKINSNGLVQWTPNGLLVCGLEKDQNNPSIATDGNGGALIAWDDQRTGYNATFAQKINSSGLPLWTNEGLLISDSYPYSFGTKICANGNGGGIVTWCQSNINSNFDDIYARQIDIQPLQNKNTIFTENKIHLYPNSVIDYLTITSSLKISKLNICNSLGQIIYENNSVNNSEVVIDFNLVASGIYFYKLVTQNNHFSNGKIIIKQ